MNVSWLLRKSRCISAWQLQQVCRHFPTPATATSARQVKHRPASKGKQSRVTQLVAAFPVLLIKLLISLRTRRGMFGPRRVVVSGESSSCSSSSSWVPWVRPVPVCIVRRTRSTAVCLSMLPKAAGEAQQHSSTTAVAKNSNNTAAKRIVSNSRVSKCVPLWTCQCTQQCSFGVNALFLLFCYQ